MITKSMKDVMVLYPIITFFFSLSLFLIKCQEISKTIGYMRISK